VKNDLKTREDIKDIIMRPIWQRFGLRKPKVETDEAAEGCRRAFGTVCSFIGTRDLIQEHIAGSTVCSFRLKLPSANLIQSVATFREVGNAEGDCY
jgi:hypothetical protein